MSSMAFFICILFDVIVFNMLKSNMHILFCVFYVPFSRGKCFALVLAGPARCLLCLPTVFYICCSSLLSSPVTPCLEPHHLSLVEVLLKAIRSFPL